MTPVMRRWLRPLLVLMPAALLLGACSGTAGNAGTAIPPAMPGAVVTVNVYVTDTGFEPSTINIPVGRTVQLVLRNVGTTEHHFHVQGLVPGNLLWISRHEAGQEADGSDDHSHDHAVGFVPWRDISPHGIKPKGNEVHAYASPAVGPMDVVLFTATNTGTFIVTCPLHPEVVGKVIVS